MHIVAPRRRLSIQVTFLFLRSQWVGTRAAPKNSRGLMTVVIKAQWILPYGCSQPKRRPIFYLFAGKSFRGWLLQSPMKLYIDSMQYFGVFLVKIYQLV